MISTVIKWKKVRLEDAKDLSQKYDLYFFYRGSNPLYIGKSYKQHIYDELKAKIRHFEFNTTGLGIYVGILDVEKSDSFNRSNQLISDVESLLIINEQPYYNNHNTISYNGRKDLKVVNNNCNGLLKRTISIWISIEDKYFPGAKKK